MADDVMKDEQDANDATAVDQFEASPAATATATAEAAGDAGIDELQREKTALQDRLLRTAAEFDNYRKRVERERRDLSDYITADVLRDFLPILDNFERALSAPANEGDAALRTGIELIHRQMLDALRKRGVTAIETLGADFDPNFHQAVISEVSEEHRDGEVMQELQRGYMIGDRLLRPAMVKVAKRS